MDIYEKTIISMTKWIHLYCYIAYEYEMASVETYAVLKPKPPSCHNQTGRENTHNKNIVYTTCGLTNLLSIWFIS